METENEFVAELPPENMTDSESETESETEDPNLTIKTLDDYFSSPVYPVQINTDDCYVCKRSWASTENYPRTTRVCGHTLHTVCHMIYESENQIDGCPYACTYNAWKLTHAIRRGRRQIAIDTTDTVLDNSMKAEGFNRDLKEIKQCIRKVSAANKEVTKDYKMARKNVLHKHIHAINYIQEDLNTSLRAVKKGDAMKKLRSGIMIYRRKARLFHTKYLVSLRDLRDRKLVNISYSVGWILERHRSMYSSWRSSIRINPGKKRWKDPLPNTA